MINPLVSIGIPAYKSFFLKDAIQSVIIQSYENIEIIILNDNPGSEIKEIVSGFTDNRIKYFENEVNIGRNNLVDCWNKVLSFASGELFALFSDDDIYHKNFVTELVELSQKYPNCNLFHCRVNIIDENNRSKYFTSSSPEFEKGVDFIWHRIKNFRLFFAPDFLVRTSSIKNIGGFINLPSAWASDELTWYKIANNGGVAATDKILCYWRESDQNISMVGNGEKKIISISEYHNKLNSFIEHELIIEPNDQDIYKDLVNNIPTKRITDFGNALKSGLSPNYIAIFTIFKLWLKNKKKYNIPFASLIWGIMLHIKSIRNSNR